MLYDGNEKYEHVVSWMTREGEFSRLQFRWLGEAVAKAEELKQQHEDGEIQLYSLQLTSTTTFIY